MRKKIEGRVVVEFTITPAGSVDADSINIVTSEPKGIFDASVVRAIQRWRFRPLIVNGVAVSSRVQQELEFSLEK